MASGKSSKDSNRRKILLRYALISVLIVLFCSLVVWKLIDTTIISADKWNAKANEELSKTTVINPERGDILATDGSVLATNLRFYTVRMDYRAERFAEQTLLLQIDTIADSLAHYFPRKTAKEWRSHLLAPLDKEKSKRPRAYTLLRNISYTDLMQLKTLPFFKIRNNNRTGLTVESTLRRVNPYGSMARRSIGMVGQTSDDPEIHGRSGLEDALDSLLYGTPGIAKKIPLTRGIVNWTDTPAVAGQNIITTIDIKMQDIVENELNDILTWTNADWGVAVLMEVATGDIKAISNLQRSDVGQYIEGVNRAVLGFEPGSVIKTLSMMIAIEDGVVRPHEVITTGGGFAYAGGRPISDSHPVASMTVAEVIERSSNIGMTKIIARRYNDRPGEFYSRVKSLGFLEPFHTGISGERVPRFDSVPDNRGGRLTLSRQCFGYATEIPPLYTLSIYNAIANGGRFVRPRLVGGLRSNEGFDSIFPVTYVRDRICSEQTAATMRSMLSQVVWGEHGTARRLQNDKVRIAGKTGTCYMVSETGGYDSRKRLAFCGFFPADNPKYSCIVLTCNPRENAFGAASTSGEVLKNVALKLYSRGMLGNSSDYRAEGGASADNRPTLYATATPGRDKTITRSVPLGGSHRVMTAPAETEAGKVPDVRGLGLREAIAVLERRGYNVAFGGTGYVVAQNPKPGTASARGAAVSLSLKE